MLRIDYMQYLGWFWDAREFCGSYENVMTPDLLNQWQGHSYTVLQRWERDLIFGMDRAFRHAYSDVLQYHMKRKQIKTESDKDKGRIKYV